MQISLTHEKKSEAQCMTGAGVSLQKTLPRSSQHSRDISPPTHAEGVAQFLHIPAGVWWNQLCFLSQPF